MKPQLEVTACKIQFKEIDRIQYRVNISKINWVLTWISTIPTLGILWFHWAPTKAHWVRVTSIFSVLMLIILQWAEITNLPPIIYQVIMFHRVVLVQIQEPLTGNQMRWWQIAKSATTNSTCCEGSITVDNVETWLVTPVATLKNTFPVIKTSRLEFAYNVTKKT